MSDRDVRLCEFRPDRAYDEQTASIVHVWADGRLTSACTFHRGLCVAMTRAVLPGPG